MSLPRTIQRIYHELAERYSWQNESRLRDIFYLLAADVAQSTGRVDDAEALRQKMIELNPNSILRPYPTFAAALDSLDIQDYLADLRRQFPPEEAEKLLPKVRANPLGQKSGGEKTLSQRDTHEILPPTARTVNMPPPPKSPRQKSPYEPTASAPLPAEESPWNARLATLWFLILLAGGAVLAAWTLVVPFLRPA
jgi:hypothetical protein